MTKQMVSKNPPSQEEIDFPEDVLAIQKALLVNQIHATEQNIQQAWSDYSDEHFAGWLAFSDPEWAANEILSHMR